MIRVLLVNKLIQKCQHFIQKCQHFIQKCQQNAAETLINSVC